MCIVHMMSLTLHVDQIPTYTNLGSYNLELLQLGPLLPSKFMPSENHYKTDMNLTQGRDPPQPQAPIWKYYMQDNTRL